MLTLPETQRLSWFKSLSDKQKQFLEQSFYLLKDVAYKHKEFYDFSFIVMPASKAYEGFVKDFLFAQKLISEKRYKGTRFRVGKALNPNLAMEDPDGFEALFDDLIDIFGNDHIPTQMWQTWKECRNKVFHYFYDQENAITLEEAEQKFQKILDTIKIVKESKIYKVQIYRQGF